MRAENGGPMNRRETSRVVRVLQFKRINRGVTAIDRKIDSRKLLGELERLEIDVKHMKCRVFEKGKVLMYYNDCFNKAPTIKVGNQIYRGSVVFLHIDGNAAWDLTVNQIKHIRAAVKRL